ncbi:hypothetical protein [Facilibium subflavum]|uniref:hypothetical protein n=1 Tax=Facilibium subflavum TaxID=2219058 RepID=UPI000E65C3A8|nr:hypothetical protein [Facilibium subflavum]
MILKKHNRRDKTASSEVNGGVLYTFKRWFTSSIATAERRSIWYSILLHLILVLGLISLSGLVHKNNKKITLVKTEDQMETKPIVHAKAVSSQVLDQQLKAYQAQQKAIIAQKEKEKQQRQAKVEAIEKRIALAKQKEAERLKAEALKQQALEKEKARQQAQKLAEKQKKLEEEKALAAEKAKKAHQAELEAQKKQREKALAALRQSVISDLNAQQQNMQVAQSATQKALQLYASVYKKKIESVWVMDDCRNVTSDKLPTVLVIPGNPPSISVSSGNTACDQSLLSAFKNAKAPDLPQDANARQLIQQGIDFQFGEAI